MERPRRHPVLPLVLLLGLLAGAAAAIGQPPCEPTTLATEVALFCESGLPTARCCKTFVASVDRGGGIPCLCRVASQAEAIVASLNANNLMSLYIACGGRDYTERARFAAAACLGSPPLGIPIIVSPPAVILLEQEGSSCNSTLLGIELTRYCHEDMKVPGPSCCSSVLMTIDDNDKECLCRVIETGDVVVSDYLGVQVMWDLYKECGGRKQGVPKDKGNCSHVPSPPPPPRSSPETIPPWKISVVAVLVVVSVVGMVVALVIVGRGIWKKVTEARQEAEQRALEEAEQRALDEAEQARARQRALQEEARARQRALQEEARARQRALQEERELDELRRLPRAPQSVEMQRVRNREAQLNEA